MPTRQKIVTTLLMSLLACQLSADVLFKIRLSKSEEGKAFYNRPDLTVHKNLGTVLIGSAPTLPSGAQLLDSEAWPAGYSYFLVQLPKHDDSYLTELSSLGTVLEQDGRTIMLKISDYKADQLRPQVHGGLIHLNRIKARLPKAVKYSFEDKNNRAEAFIQTIVAQVDSVSLHTKIKKLEDYGTRHCKTPKAVETQNWLKSQFESYGLQVTLQPVVGTTGSSANVIAVKPGTSQPDKYIIIGGHYDSIVNSGGTGVAPGADDNASGTASVLEAARILSQYSFGKTLVFCAFSAEELGLFGSETYAASLDNQNIDVEAYINQDMIGYRYQNAAVHADIACPASANPLKSFFKSTTAEYVPLLGVTDGSLPMGASSDHASFNDHGYMGIYPAEDFDHYSPYIHTTNDKIGQSVNSFYQTRLISQAAIASVALLAVDKPQLTVVSGDQQVSLSWNQFSGAVSYNIYRNNQLLCNQTTLSYNDVNVINGTTYSYYIKAVQSGNTESFPSATMTVVPNPAPALIWGDNFENSSGWTLAGDFQIQAPTAKGGEHGNPDPAQAHGGSKVLGSDLSGIGTHAGDYEGSLAAKSSYAESPVINCTDFNFIKLNFYRWLNIEQPQYDNAWLEIHDGSQWQTLFHNDATIEDQAWQKMEYDINQIASGKQIKLRFSIGTTDDAWFYSGWNVDDLEVTGIAKNGISETKKAESIELLGNYPNPFNPVTDIRFRLAESSEIVLTVYNSTGEIVQENRTGMLDRGTHSVTFNGTSLNSGIYLYQIKTGFRNLTGKMMFLK